MLDLKFIRENPDKVRQALKAKLVTIDLDRLLELDKERRTLLQEVEEQKKIRNRANDQIGLKKKKGEPVQDLVASMSTVSQKIDEIDIKVGDIDKSISTIQINIPNIPHESVPVSKDSSGNRVVREWGQKRQFNFEASDHLELGRRLGWLSFERGAVVTGSAFPVFQGRGARLGRGLINFMLDLQTKKHDF